MKYNIFINQVKAVEWKLSMSEAAVFAFIYELPSWAQPTDFNGKTWYFCSKNKIIDEFPLITDKPNTVYKIFKSLEEKDLIQITKLKSKDYVTLTSKGKQYHYNSQNPEEKVATNSGSDETPLGDFSKKDGKNSELGSEKNPTYTSTNTDTNTKYKIVTPKAKTIRERKVEFLNSIMLYAMHNPRKYPKLMYKEFGEWWTTPEQNKATPKMRSEEDKFFHIPRRLSTWFKHSKDFVLTAQWQKDEQVGTLEELFKPLLND